MTRENFEGICQVASSGKVKWVDNLGKHKSGRVIACSPERFEVEVRGKEHKHEEWQPEVCKERTYGYHPIYR